MRTAGDVILFDDEDFASGQHEAIRALKDVSLGDVHMPYGFRLVIGDDKKYLEPMAKEEWLGLMKDVNPSLDHDVVWPLSCVQTGPTTCSSHYCGNGYRCTRMYNPNTQQYWCGCA